MAERDSASDSAGGSAERRPGAASTAGWVGAVVLAATPFLLFAIFLLFDRLVR